MQDVYKKYKNSFTVNSLMPILEYFEDLCWDNIKKRIPSNYKVEINDNTKQYIRDYFKSSNNNKKINKKTFTTALRKLISRSIASSRQDIDMKSELKLKEIVIKRKDLWNNDLLKSPSFNEEIEQIFKEEILVGHCWKLYTLLEEKNNIHGQIQEGQTNQVNKANQKNQVNQANQVNQTNQTAQTNQTSQTNQVNQTNQTNQVNQTNQTNQVNQTNQTAQTNQTSQTNQVNQTSQTNQVNQANQVNQTNQTAQTNQTNNNDNENAQDNNNINGNENSQNNNNETNTNNVQNPV